MYTFASACKFKTVCQISFIWLSIKINGVLTFKTETLIELIHIWCMKLFDSVAHGSLKLYQGIAFYATVT